MEISKSQFQLEPNLVRQFQSEVKVLKEATKKEI